MTGKNKRVLAEALAEIEGQMHSLLMVREGLLNLGITNEVQETTPETPAPTSYRTHKKAKARKKRALVQSGAVKYLRQVIAESRVPMTTEQVTERAIAAGWVPTADMVSKPSALVYGSLSYLAKQKEVQRIGTEWSRV